MKCSYSDLTPTSRWLTLEEAHDLMLAAYRAGRDDQEKENVLTGRISRLEQQISSWRSTAQRLFKLSTDEQAKKIYDEARKEARERSEISLNEQ